MMINVDSEIKDRLISDCLNNNYWEVDFATGETRITGTYKKLLGYDDNEISQNIDFWRSLIHKEDLEELSAAFKDILEGKTDYLNIEHRFRAKNNNYIYFSIKGKVLRDDKGTPIYMTGFYNNLSKCQLRDEIIKNYNTIFNNINDIIFLCEVDKDFRPKKIIEVNDIATKLLGYSREEFLQMTPDAFNPYHTIPEYISKAKEEVYTKLKNNTQNSFLTIQINMLRKDKSIIPVEISSHFFYVGKKLVKLSVIRDISARLESEKELKDSIERNKKIIELAPDAIFVHEEGVITFANEATARLAGAASKEEIIGRSLSDFITSSYKKLTRFRQQLLKKGIEVEAAEMDLLRIDGSKFRGIVASAPMPTNNGFASISYVKDISEQKWIMEENKRLLEQVIEYDRLKTEFFSNISHELRTPLNIILSSIQLLNMFYSLYLDEPHKFAEAFEKYMGVMKQNSYRLLKLINNLIDLTKIDSGYLKINFSNHNIVEVVENIVLSVATYIESKGISLTFDTEIEELIVACDEDKIERIILNLLSNAIKFTKSGGAIDVYVWQEGENINISVKDTGCGIPKDKLQTVFERFRQVDNILTRRAEGSGIGLALVKALLEAHEGTITVESEVGKGSEFIIKLPIKQVNTYNEEDIHKNNEDALNQNKIERISIEFSDIYS